MRPDLKALRRRTIERTALRVDPQTNRLRAVYRNHLTPDGCLSEPFETETDATGWECLCFSVSNLRLFHVAVSVLVGIVLGALSLICGFGLFGAEVTAAIVALLWICLFAGDPAR